MKRLLPALFAFTLLLLPTVAVAAETTFFGPIVPTECSSCPCSYAAVLEAARHVMNIVISLALLIATIIIAVAGFMFIMSVTNPEQRSKARAMLINAVIGIVIVLAAWLVVDFIMKMLYSGEDGSRGRFGPWNTILSDADGSFCIEEGETRSLFDGSLADIPGAGGDLEPTNPNDPTPGEPVEGSDGSFTYDPGIAAQRSHASSRLNSFLGCVANRVPANVGRISSISDSNITSGSKTFAQCAAGGCNHSAGSCHYGGRGSCNGQSYAVDFGDENNRTSLWAAAVACGADYKLDEGDHLHFSVGKSCGCN